MASLPILRIFKASKIIILASLHILIKWLFGNAKLNISVVKKSKNFKIIFEILCAINLPSCICTGQKRVVSNVREGQRARFWFDILWDDRLIYDWIWSPKWWSRSPKYNLSKCAPNPIVSKTIRSEKWPYS